MNGSLVCGPFLLFHEQIYSSISEQQFGIIVVTFQELFRSK